MKRTIEIDLKWWHFRQNNSGGSFITNDVVAPDVFIEARSADEAVARARTIFEPYSDYCSCCGERWSYWVDDDEGTDTPELYGERLDDVKRESYRNEARLHHFSGRVESYLFKEKSA